MSGLFSFGHLRGRIAALGAVIVLLLAAGILVALTHASAQPTPGARAAGGHRHAASGTPSAAAAPLQVVSVSPADAATDVNGVSPIRVMFSARLAASSPMPAVYPHIPGSWQHVGADAIQFLPARGFAEYAHVRVEIPAGSSGIRSAAGATLATPTTVAFETGGYSPARLAQLLAQLGYLPLTWTPASGTAAPLSDASAQLGAAYAPPAGTYSWKPGYPLELHYFWHDGAPSSLIMDGAVMAFESDHGLPMDGVGGHGVWDAMFSALAAGQVNTHGYSYALASEASPETLTVWHNGREILRTLANTGIPAAPTTIGTSPVYLRYTFQIMRGTNPDGSKYADPVSWVSYFRAGEAVHYFPRYSYGYQQSLGCVELPYAQAEYVWPYMTYGTLVTVAA